MNFSYVHGIFIPAKCEEKFSMQSIFICQKFKFCDDMGYSLHEIKGF